RLLNGDMGFSRVGVVSNPRPCRGEREPDAEADIRDAGIPVMKRRMLRDDRPVAPEHPRNPPPAMSAWPPSNRPIRGLRSSTRSRPERNHLLIEDRVVIDELPAVRDLADL